MKKGLAVLAATALSLGLAAGPAQARHREVVEGNWFGHPLNFQGQSYRDYGGLACASVPTVGGGRLSDVVMTVTSDSSAWTATVSYSRLVFPPGIGIPAMPLGEGRIMVVEGEQWHVAGFWGYAKRPGPRAARQDTCMHYDVISGGDAQVAHLIPITLPSYDEFMQWCVDAAGESAYDACVSSSGWLT